MTDNPFAVVLDNASSRANKTGSWRTERPVYVDLMPPCNDACPAGENVQRWLYDAEEGRYEAAWRQVMEDNPFPAIMGRVCYHPCQTACNRGQLDEAVGINAVERFIGDEAIRRGWTVPVTAAAVTGTHVLVVGGGPAGLAAAYHLRRLGHRVTLREAGERLGGMMRYGIPSYRLPRDILDAEVRRVVGMGVTVELGRTVTDVRAELATFDAAFLAIGAQISRNAYLPAGDSAGVLDALAVLHGVADGEAPQLGRRVIVYGGGNTAIDVARSARRLGATDAVVVYRRTRERMPAQPFEVDEAEQEGVRMRWLSTIATVAAGTVRVERMRLDEQGRPEPTGEFDDLAADSVVLAIGQDVDRSVLSTLAGVELVDGSVPVGPDLMTAHPGVFAGGDMAGTERTVTAAVGDGKRAARAIDAWLRGQPTQTGSRPPLAAFDRLNPWYYADAPASLRPMLEPARRASTFDEVVGGLDERTALYEARRCLSCGNCFECDNCYGMCPDNAIVKLGPGLRFAIDYDYCKGCGICVTECPAGAIDLVPEVR